MATNAALITGAQAYPLARELAIGRSGENDVVLLAKTVSRRHALLTFREGRWFIEDCGSANGTFVNGDRISVGIPHPLHHADRIQLGSEKLVFSWPAEAADPDRTESFEEVPFEAELSPFQHQVVRALCGAWLGGETLDELPSNREIASQLGTPGADETVKAALRRIYAKAGLSDVPAHAKRRVLCRIARQRGWI